MKTIQFTLIILIAITACKENNEVIIKGTISDEDFSEVQFTTNKNAYYNGWFKDKVRPDSAGNFQMTVKIDNPTFVGVLYKSSFKNLIVEPGNTYDISFIGKKHKFGFTTPKSTAQEFYDSLPSLHPDLVGISADNNKDYKSIQNKLNDDLNSELEAINQTELPENVRRLIKADRLVYYNVALASLASRYNVNYLRRNNLTTPPEIMNMWEKAVADTFLSQPLAQQSLYYFDLMRHVFWFNFYTKLNCDSIWPIRKQMREKGLYHTYHLQLAKELIQPDILEYYEASYLQSMAMQHKYEFELIALFERFKEDYSASSYTPYIDSNIKEIVAFHKKVENDFTTESVFLENYELLNTLGECLEPFKGKKVYVDIWSTSCSPCKEEFAYNQQLKKLLAQKEVSILYLSEDGDQHDKRWKDMIKYYDLKGYHIRASKALKEDLQNVLGGPFGIPRYLIIDEKGNILNNDAPRPSQPEKLEKLL